MRERYTSPPQRGYQQDDSLFGLSDLASLSAFIYFLFFLVILTIYSSNPLEPTLFGFYKLSLYFQLLSFFSVFFLPALLIYIALDFTKSIVHTVIVLAYPLLVLGGIAILRVPASPPLVALSGLMLFAFYFVLGLNRSVSERKRRGPRPQRVVRPGPPVQNSRPLAPAQPMPPEQESAVQRQRLAQPPPTTLYAPPSRSSEPRQEGRAQYKSPDGFLSKLDRFLDRYDYVNGEAVKKGSQRGAAYYRDRRKGGR